MMKQGSRPQAGSGSKKLRVKNFMLNFMFMKISCNNTLPEYFSSELFWPPPAAFRLPPCIHKDECQ
jgi:hypothetical protein